MVGVVGRMVEVGFWWLWVEDLEVGAWCAVPATVAVFTELELGFGFGSLDWGQANVLIRGFHLGPSP